jgi:hypothetical protein
VEKKQTALFLAVSQGYRNIIELLIEKKANVNAEDAFGNTPLHVAVRKHSMCAFEVSIKFSDFAYPIKYIRKYSC